MRDHYDVVVVGGGQGGVHVATTLAKDWFEGSIGLLSAESVLPYERPPLSKGYLMGEQALSDITFRPADYWERPAIEIQLDAKASGVDPQEHTVRLADGRDVGYGKLVWATGGTPRRLPLPGSDLAGVMTVRDVGDINLIRGALPRVSRAVIIGGGYIGLETAAAFRKLGVEVTLVEVQDRLLARVTCPVVSAFYLNEHLVHGVDVRLESGVSELRGPNGELSSVVLSDGEVLEAQIAVIGVGIAPNVQELADAGAAVGNGVEVDGYCRTSLPDVYAIGDCASHPNRFAGGQRVRLESVQNAIEQAKTVSDHILGRERPYDVAPWFWSNQYDTKLKTIGLLSGHDEVIVRGTPGTGSFSVAYLREGRLIAMDCINTPKDFAQARALVERGALVDKSALRDADVTVKEAEIIPVGAL